MVTKLVAVDLDGTLLRSDETLSSTTIKAIRLCKKNGVIFVITTSRSLPSLVQYADLLQPDAIISSGGARAWIGMNEVYRACFSPEKADKYISKCLTEPSVEYIRVTCENTDLTNNPSVPIGGIEYGHYEKTDFKRKIHEMVYKITIKSANIDAVQRLFRDDDQCRLITSYAGKHFHKLAHCSATKERALARVIDIMKINREEILSFGDDTSDINMLSFSGIGVAMGNSPIAVKAVANTVCDTNDNDGVARYLLEHFTFRTEA